MVFLVQKFYLDAVQYSTLMNYLGTKSKLCIVVFFNFPLLFKTFDNIRFYFKKSFVAHIFATHCRVPVSFVSSTGFQEPHQTNDNATNMQPPPPQQHQGNEIIPATPAKCSSTKTASSSRHHIKTSQPQHEHVAQQSATSNAVIQKPVHTVSPTPTLSTFPIKKRLSGKTDKLQKPISATAVVASSTVVTVQDKKELKRAANRRSAQLSRKRKKHFIEELKEENDDLRRKEQILRSIPDLIVVFDSGGRLGFVSHSVTNFLDFKPTDLEGTSFWERLCDESVRLLKAAFMDALAARETDMDTAPLGNGLWELRLVDKNGLHKLITLNGVVHFSGEVPECVCSIRPKDDDSTKQKQTQSEENRASTGICSTSTKPPADTSNWMLMGTIKPQQSVTSRLTEDISVKVTKNKNSDSSLRRGVRMAAQISDGESVISEEGSDRS